MYVTGAEYVHVAVPTGRALTVTVYTFASAVLVAYANSVLGTVEVGKVIRLGVVLEVEYVTWYSIERPQSVLGVTMNEMLFAGSVITFWLYPLIVDKSMLMLQTAGLERARNLLTSHPELALCISNPVNSSPAGIV